MKGNEAVGHYNAAYKIVLLLIGFGGLASTAILPAMFRLYKKSIDDLGKFMVDVFRILALLGMPIAVLGLFLSAPITDLIYGAEYGNSILALTLLLWSVCTVFINIPFATCLLASGRQVNYLICVSIGAGINFVLNFILIQKYSLNGAAVATIVTEVIVLTLLILASRKVVKLTIIPTILRIILANFSLFIFMYFFQGNIMVKTFIGIIIYILLVFVLGIIKKADLKLIPLLQTSKNRKGFNDQQ
jgi:O-antigen/teichoic acid export membrane protein